MNDEAQSLTGKINIHNELEVNINVTNLITLLELLQAGKLSSKQILEIMKSLANALENTPPKGSGHRDIKPGNIFLDKKTNEVIISDLGLIDFSASTLDVDIDKEGHVNLSDAVSINLSGTLHYASPERLRGEEANKTSNIYALGLVLFKMLTGRLPYEGSIQEIISGHLGAEIPSVLEFDKSLPPKYDTVIRRALAKNPENRFSSLDALINALREVIELENNIRITLGDIGGAEEGFSTNYVSQVITPLIEAIFNIHIIIEEIHGRSSTNIRILAIRYGSVTVDLTGGIRDTIQLVLDLIVPWRRQNQKQLAEMQVAEKEVELKQKEVEIEQIKATILREADKAEDESTRTEAEATKIAAETKKLAADALLLEEQARELAIKNKTAELQYMELALAMVDRIKPGMKESERFYYAMKLVEPTRLLVTSPLELVDVQLINDDNVEGDSPTAAASTEEEE